MGEFLNKTYKKPSDVAEENLKVRNLTKREYFAAMAMQGILSNPGMEDLTSRRVSETSVMFADALLAELGKDDG